MDTAITNIIQQASPTDFDYEKTQHLILKWTMANEKENILTLNRWTQTITTFDQARDVFENGIKKFRDYLAGSYRTDISKADHYSSYQRITKLFVGKLVAIEHPVEKISIDLLGVWANIRNFINEYDSTASQTINQKMTTLAKTIVTSRTVVSKYTLEDIWKYGFPHVTIAFCKTVSEKSCETFEDLKNLKELCSFLSDSIYKLKGDDQKRVNEIREILQTKAIDFISTVIAKPGKTTAEFALLASYREVSFTSIPNEGIHTMITQCITEFLETQIADKKPWYEIQTLQSQLGIAPLSYYKLAIENSNLAELQHKLKVNAYKQGELVFRNLLRQEELLLLEIWDTKTLDVLWKLKEKIPAQLPHLHSEVMKHAKQLLG